MKGKTGKLLSLLLSLTLALVVMAVPAFAAVAEVDIYNDNDDYLAEIALNPEDITVAQMKQQLASEYGYDVSTLLLRNGSGDWFSDDTKTLAYYGIGDYSYSICMYSGMKCPVSLTVKPKAAPVVTLEDWNVGDQANTPTVSSDSNPDNATPTFYYKLRYEPDSAYSTEVPTEVGNYTVKAVVPASQNYREGSGTCYFNILPQPQSQGMEITLVIDNPKAVVTQNQKAPAAPVVLKETINAISVQTVKGVEYSIDGRNWQSSGVFKKLKPGTKYTVQARKPASEGYNASPAAKTPAKTLSYSNLLSTKARVNASGNKIAVKWAGVPGATSYDVYVQYSGATFSSKPTATVKASKTSVVITKVNGRAVDTSKNYKVYVTAKSGKTVLGKTPALHGVASGNKRVYTDPSGIVLKNTALTLKRGKAAAIGASVTLVNSKLRQPAGYPPALRYVSSDPRIATVNANGKVTALQPGLTYIYVIARTGLTTWVPVTVK